MRTTGEIDDMIAEVTNTVINRDIVGRAIKLLEDLNIKRLVTWTPANAKDDSKLRVKCDLTKRGLKLLINYDSGSRRTGPMSLTIDYNDVTVFMAEKKLDSSELRVQKYVAGGWDDILEIDVVISLFSEQEKRRIATEEKNIREATEKRRAEPASKSLLDWARKLGIEVA